MKKWLLIALATSLTLLAFARFTNSDSPETMTTVKALSPDDLSWSALKVDLGEIPKDVEAKAKFTVTNNGDEPLIIESAKATCGCTVADYPKQPILKGETGTINVVYNAKKPGKFNKRITLKTNATEDPLLLSVLGNVVEM